MTPIEVLRAGFPPEDITPEAMVAFDAIEAGRVRAYELLAGLPATMRIGSDRYAWIVVRATPSLKTIYARHVSASPDLMTIPYRLTSRGYTRGRNYRLTVGKADPHLDPSF